MHDTKKNAENINNITVKVDKGNTKDQLKEQHCPKPNANTRNNTKTVVVLGDSMIKDISGWEVSKNLPSHNKIYVWHFAGAKSHRGLFKTFSVRSL